VRDEHETLAGRRATRVVDERRELMLESVARAVHGRGRPHDLSAEGLEEAGERINNLERAYFVREGFTREEDHLRGRIAEEPVPEGPFKGERIDPQKFEKMLDDYYRLRGWDIETGIPTRKRLEKLDLKDVADDLERLGKLPIE